MEGDLSTPSCVERDARRRTRSTTVFHLAAQTIVGTAADSPGADVRHERPRDLDAARGLPRAWACERVVVASSDKAYGAHDELPYREDFALRPTAPYEASKAAADLIARSYWPPTACRWR